MAGTGTISTTELSGRGYLPPKALALAKVSGVKRGFLWLVAASLEMVWCLVVVRKVRVAALTNVAVDLMIVLGV